VPTAGPSVSKYGAATLAPQAGSWAAHPAGITWDEGVNNNDDIIEIVEPIEELYTILKTKIVGLQYYRGLVGAGQEVNIVREPTNKYDRYVPSS
jgi:hypothetical protein